MNISMSLVAVVVFIVSCGAGRMIGQAFTETVEREQYQVLIGEDAVVLSTRVRVTVYEGDEMTQYTCREEIIKPSGLEFLVPAWPGSFDPVSGFPVRATFLPAEPVDSRWALWPNQNPVVPLLSYSWNQTRPDWPPGYSPRFDTSQGRTTFLFGLRLTHTDGIHFGWLRMTRPSTAITNLFEFDSHAIHPLPNEPIRAGMEPPAPVLSAEPGDPESGTAFILRWAAGYSDNAGYRLEAADDLTPPVEWQSVDSYAGEHLVPVGTENRFYRLRSP